MATRATLANQTGRGFRELVGVVVGAGRMDKTVTVRVGGTKWHQGLAKVCLPTLRTETYASAQRKRQKKLTATTTISAPPKH